MKRMLPLKLIVFLWLLTSTTSLYGEGSSREFVSCQSGGEATLSVPVNIGAKRAVKSGEKKLELQVPLPTGEVTVILSVNKDLVSDSFVAGTLNQLNDISDDIANCHFIGHAYRNGVAIGTAGVSDCGKSDEPLTGLIKIGGATYSLEQSLDNSQLQILRIQGDEGNSPESSLPSVGAATSVRTVELLVINDKRRFDYIDGTVQDVTREAIELMNMVDAIYLGTSTFTVPIRIKISAHISFTGADPFIPLANPSNPAEIDSYDLLSKLVNWRTTTPGLPNSDNTVLLSGYDFDGGVVGLAYLDAMCQRDMVNSISSDISASVVQADLRSLPTLAAITAHEMAHNFGSYHDGDASIPAAASCTTSSFIMSATLASLPPTQFSSCSVTQINSFTTSFNVACLDNEPLIRTQCGNGVIEVGEACDCGMEDCSLSDPCCNGATCQLKTGATCSAHEGCCDSTSCQPRTAGTPCRDPLSSCDQAEVCNGTDAFCPGDVKKVDGLSCIDALFNSGSCFQGYCQSDDSYCQLLGDTISQDWESCPSAGNVIECNRLRCQDVGAPMTCGSVTSGGQLIERLNGATCATGAQCTDGVCSTTPNPCSTITCLNGSCLVDPLNNTVACACSQGWTGTQCDQNINECLRSPCINGSCSDQAGSYSCTCAPGWEGTNCDQETNECATNPCVQGTCTDGFLSFSCSCPEGWSGSLCDVPPPPPAASSVDLSAIQDNLRKIRASMKIGRKSLSSHKKRNQRIRKARRTVRGSLSVISVLVTQIPTTFTSSRPVLVPDSALSARTNFNQSVSTRLRQSKRRIAWRKFLLLVRQLEVAAAV